jgi:HEAT repeat protein
MPYFCPSCLNELDMDCKHCPFCACDISCFSEGKDFVDKLIAALHHPEPSTPVRAAWILGWLQDERAIGPLYELARDPGDMYIRVAAVRALMAIGTKKASELAEACLQTVSVVERGLLRDKTWRHDDNEPKGGQENDQ